MIRLKSVEKPFRSREVHHHALSVIARADAMGLLPDDELIEVLDRETMNRVLHRIVQAGIGRGLVAKLVAGLTEPVEGEADQLQRLLGQLNNALEESPAPMYEWPHLTHIFGIDQLARLLAASPSSIRRYKENARATPDAISGRLHFLALVVGDLAGAYNDIGVRRWFERARTLLGDRAPKEFLRGEWSPTDPGPTKVRELARSLVAAAAT